MEGNPTDQPFFVYFWVITIWVIKRVMTKQDVKI